MKRQEELTAMLYDKACNGGYYQSVEGKIARFVNRTQLLITMLTNYPLNGFIAIKDENGVDIFNFEDDKLVSHEKNE